MLVVRHVLFACIFLASAWAAPAPAQEGLSVRSAGILEFGTYVSDIDAFILDSGVADHNKILSSNFRLVEFTNQIQAQLGTQFGLRYLVRGEPEGSPVDIGVVVDHPPLFNPKSGETYLFSRTTFTPALGKPAHVVWSFDQGWTLCPGRWIIRLEYQGRLLAKQEFTVSLKR